MNKIIIIVVLVLLVIFSQSTYVVDEKQQVVVTQFGRPIGDAVTTPGIKFKMPFIHTVNYFEKRYMNPPPTNMKIPSQEVSDLKLNKSFGR